MLMASTKVLTPNFRDYKSMTYHALYGCREGFYETVNVDEFVFMPLAGKKSVFTTEHTEITEKIFLFSVGYLCELCALCG